jgi:AraC-like DNA-binding protein
LEKLALRSGYRVGELSEALGCSERYVQEVFGRDVGVPPKLWLRWERMVVARRLLGGGMDMEEVREGLGFCEGGAFRREFRRMYGLPPFEFARKFLEPGLGRRSGLMGEILEPRMARMDTDEDSGN